MDDTARSTVTNPVVKAATAIGGSVIANLTWGDIASITATIYSVLVTSEWLWKKMIRPYCIRNGWIQWRPVRRTDRDK